MVLRDVVSVDAASTEEGERGGGRRADTSLGDPREPWRSLTVSVVPRGVRQPSPSVLAPLGCVLSRRAAGPSPPLKGDLGDTCPRVLQMGMGALPAAQGSCHRRDVIYTQSGTQGLTCSSKCQLLSNG